MLLQTGLRRLVGSHFAENLWVVSIKSQRQLTSYKVISRTMSSAADSDAVSSEQESLLEYVFNNSMTRWKTSNDRSKPVLKFMTPPELASLVDFDISKDPVNITELKKLCDAAFEYSINTDHPRFYNQLFAGPDKYGLAGDLVVTALNVNAHTYEVAPFFIMTEMATIKRSLKLFGFCTGEGTFCPGGSYSCMLAMNIARYKKCPTLKTKGSAGSPPLVLFTSKQAHYSTLKNAALLGLGTDNCIEIECDEMGKMIPSELEKAVLKAKGGGMIPFFVVATAGTTVLGAFDPFNEIADICEKHELWLHTDACWGGAALFSRKHKHLCNGMERSDSVAWNPHKMIQMPLQCSLLLSKHEGLFSEANSTSVPYLFQPDKPYDVSYDVGRGLIQCGRRPDSVKLWLAWKANGDAEFERRVDKAFENSRYLAELVRKRKNFRLVIPNPEFTNISFWYIPPSLRGCEENQQFWQKLGGVAPTIKSRMQKSGSLLVGYQPVGNKVNFFRMIVISPSNTNEDMEFILDEIERQGADL